MKNIILLIGIIILLSCGNTNKKVVPKFKEKELSFLHLRFGYDKTNNWIKKPENILMLHETFKKIGYKNLINHEDWISEWNWYLDVSKSPKNLIDSLEITYNNLNDSPKYYQEFWKRRKHEGNTEIVYKIIKEVKQELLDSLEIPFNKNVVNDTLFNLLLFEYPLRELNDKEANEHLNYLIKIGLHESAYNLISGENIKYENVNWNRTIKEVIKDLIRKENENQYSPWFQDDVK